MIIELHGLYEEPNQNPNQNNPTTHCYGYRDDTFLRNSHDMAKQYFLWQVDQYEQEEAELKRRSSVYI